MLRELKRRQAQEGRSLGQIASELLAAALALPDTESREADTDRTVAPFHWYSQPMDALVDLKDKEAVQRILDQDDDLP